MRQEDVEQSVWLHKKSAQDHDSLYNYEARSGEWSGVPYVSFNTNPGTGRYARKVIYFVDCLNDRVLLFPNQYWEGCLRRLYEESGNKPTGSQLGTIFSEATGIVKKVSSAEEAITVLEELYKLYDGKLKKAGMGM